MMNMIAISLAYMPNSVAVNVDGTTPLPTAKDQAYIEMDVALGTSIYQALQLVGWLEQYPELANWCEQIKESPTSLATKPNARHWCVGIYSQKKPLDYILQANDRIEVYRPLSIDPMKRRKRQAKW